MLTGLFKNTRFGPLSEIHTRVFHLWKSVALEIAWDGDVAHLYFFLSRVFARLEMRHTRDFGVGISNYAYWTF